MAGVLPTAATVALATVTATVRNVDGIFALYPATVAEPADPLLDETKPVIPCGVPVRGGPPTCVVYQHSDGNRARAQDHMPWINLAALLPVDVRHTICYHRPVNPPQSEFWLTKHGRLVEYRVPLPSNAAEPDVAIRTLTQDVLSVWEGATARNRLDPMELLVYNDGAGVLIKAAWVEANGVEWKQATFRSVTVRSFALRMLTLRWPVTDKRPRATLYLRLQIVDARTSEPTGTPPVWLVQLNVLRTDGWETAFVNAESATAAAVNLLRPWKKGYPEGQFRVLALRPPWLVSAIEVAVNAVVARRADFAPWRSWLLLLAQPFAEAPQLFRPPPDAAVLVAALSDVHATLQRWLLRQKPNGAYEVCQTESEVARSIAARITRGENLETLITFGTPPRDAGVVFQARVHVRCFDVSACDAVASATLPFGPHRFLLDRLALPRDGLYACVDGPDDLVAALPSHLAATALARASLAAPSLPGTRGAVATLSPVCVSTMATSAWQQLLAAGHANNVSLSDAATNRLLALTTGSVLDADARNLNQRHRAAVVLDILPQLYAHCDCGWSVASVRAYELDDTLTAWPTTVEEYRVMVSHGPNGRYTQTHGTHLAVEYERAVASVQALRDLQPFVYRQFDIRDLARTGVVLDPLTTLPDRDFVPSFADAVCYLHLLDDLGAGQFLSLYRVRVDQALLHTLPGTRAFAGTRARALEDELRDHEADLRALPGENLFAWLRRLTDRVAAVAYAPLPVDATVPDALAYLCTYEKAALAAMRDTRTRFWTPDTLADAVAAMAIHEVFDLHMELDRIRGRLALLPSLAGASLRDAELQTHLQEQRWRTTITTDGTDPVLFRTALYEPGQARRFAPADRPVAADHVDAERVLLLRDREHRREMVVLLRQLIELVNERTVHANLPVVRRALALWEADAAWIASPAAYVPAAVAARVAVLVGELDGSVRDATAPNLAPPTAPAAAHLAAEPPAVPPVLTVTARQLYAMTVGLQHYPLRLVHVVPAAKRPRALTFLTRCIGQLMPRVRRTWNLPGRDIFTTLAWLIAVWFEATPTWPVAATNRMSLRHVYAAWRPEAIAASGLADPHDLTAITPEMQIVAGTAAGAYVAYVAECLRWSITYDRTEGPRAAANVLSYLGPADPLHLVFHTPSASKWAPIVALWAFTRIFHLNLRIFVTVSHGLGVERVGVNDPANAVPIFFGVLNDPLAPTFALELMHGRLARPCYVPRDLAHPLDITDPRMVQPEHCWVTADGHLESFRRDNERLCEWQTDDDDEVPDDASFPPMPAANPLVPPREDAF